MKKALTILILLTIFGIPPSEAGRGLFKMRKKTENHTNEQKNIPEKTAFYITQPLDHFNLDVPADGLHVRGVALYLPHKLRFKETFNQSYWVNPWWWDKRDGPVFLYLGAEEYSMNMFASNSGMMWNLTLQHNALLVCADHRFFGESIPGLEMEQLQYLTSQQALADFAFMYEQVVADFGLTAKHKWVVFGGSVLHGPMAAWFRLKYPHLVIAAVASSAPVRAKVNLEYFNSAVADSFRDPHYGGSTQCANAFREAFQTLDKKLAVALDEVIEDFNVCRGAMTNDRDIFLFVNGIASELQENVMDNGHEAGGIGFSCWWMKDRKFRQYASPYRRLTDLVMFLQKMATVNLELSLSSPSVLDFRSMEFCSDPSWADYVIAMKNTSRESISQVTFDRQKLFIACNEFGFFPTCDVEAGCPYSHHIHLKYFLNLCFEIFGLQPDTIMKQIDKTNAYFGADHPNASRIIFVNGEIDPWKSLSVLKNQPENDIVSLMIPHGAHCSDMALHMAPVPIEVQKAWVTISNQIGKWLHEAAWD